MTIPTVLNQSGRVNQTPAQLLAQLLALVSASNPGYTASLPGSLIEDISSTDVGALLTMDQYVTELINSLTPYGANEFLLNQLGQQFGVAIGTPVNTSVYVVFTGTVGFVIQPGFVVSDGVYQYVIQDGGAVGAGGQSAQLYCVATQSGTWPVPSNTVNQIITSVPSSVTLSVTNPNTGTPATSTESAESYRARVLQAGLASATGFPAMLKTLLGNVTGVQQRLISVRQLSGGYQVIVGGGDPYSVAYAIYRALFDFNQLQPSTTQVTGITNANPGVVTTQIEHGFSEGQNNVYISGVVGTSGVNGGPYTVHVVSPYQFSFGVNTTSSGTYISGGVVTPNSRTVTVNLIDFPDTYAITFVNPPAQTVQINLLWNTTAPNIVSPAAVAQLGQAALVGYVNSVLVGQPLNLFVMQQVFQAAVASVVSPPFLDRMVFTVTIDNQAVNPQAGTGLIVGDPESYFTTNSSLVVVTQG